MSSFLPARHDCPLCSSPHIDPYLDIPYPSAPFRTSVCSSCGFIFMNPRFDDHSVSEMYGQEYYGGSAGFVYIDERKKEKYASYVWNARLASIRRFVKSGNFLDVGASFGGFMAAASKFFSVYGIELSSYSGSAAQERFGGNVHIGTLKDHPFPPSFFSVITMIELIEHLSDPKESIDECFRLLAPGGLLVIQTADCSARQAVNAGSAYHYFLPGHLSYFTEDSLRQALKKAGFSSVRVFRPVDFGLSAKLRKSRGDFTSIRDYRRWLTISWYHVKGYFRYRGKALTSSMVVYAVK